MYNIEFTNKMKRDVKRVEKRGKNMTKLSDVLKIIVGGNQLPIRYKDHQLTGNMKNYRECHIESDWLLIYKIDSNKLIFYATGTGTHSELFG